MQLVLTSKISLFDTFKEKPFWQYAFENNSNSVIIQHVNKLLQSGNVAPTDLLKYMHVLKKLEQLQSELFSTIKTKLIIPEILSQPSTLDTASWKKRIEDLHNETSNDDKNRGLKSRWTDK